MNPTSPTTAPRAARLIAIGSGKGGVGKTWLAITLAHAIARSGRRALLFDGDLGLANVDIQLGLTPALDLGTVIAGKATLAQVIARHEPGGFDVVAGRSGSGALAGLDAPSAARIVAMLRQAARGYDAVLLDLGAGLDPVARLLAAASDLLLAVATADPASLTDAYAMLKLHAADTQGQAGASEPRILVNQAASPAEGARTYATLLRACRCFLGRSPACAGVIRRDPRVLESSRRQALLLTRHPSTPAATDVEDAARALMQGCQEGNQAVPLASGSV